MADYVLKPGQSIADLHRQKQLDQAKDYYKRKAAIYTKSGDEQKAAEAQAAVNQIDAAQNPESQSYNVYTGGDIDTAGSRQQLQDVQTGNLRIKDTATGKYKDVVVTREGTMSLDYAQRNPEAIPLTRTQRQQEKTGEAVYNRAIELQNTPSTPAAPISEANNLPIYDTFSGIPVLPKYAEPQREVRPSTPEEIRSLKYQTMWENVVGKKRAADLEQGYRPYKEKAAAFNSYTTNLLGINKIQGTGAGAQAARGALLGAKTIAIDYPVWLPPVANARFLGETVLSGGKNIFDIGTGIYEGFTNPATRIETGVALGTVAFGPKISEVATRPARNAFVSYGAKESGMAKVSTQVAEEGKTFPVSSDIKDTLGAFKRSRFSNTESTVDAMLGRSEPFKGIKRTATFSSDGMFPTIGTKYEFKEKLAFKQVSDSDFSTMKLNTNKEFMAATHASTGKRFSGTVEAGPMGTAGKEDPGLFVTPSQDTSPYFFRIDSGSYGLLPNPTRDLLPKGAKAHMFYYEKIQRYPRNVIEPEGYAVIKNFLKKRANSGEIYITKRHELGLGLVRDKTQVGTSEMEGVIPLNSKFVPVDKSRWNFASRVKGYRQYMVYKGRNIPVYEYNYMGKYLENGKARGITRELAGDSRLAKEYGTYEQYRVKSIGQYAGLSGRMSIKGYTPKSYKITRSQSSYKALKYSSSLPSYKASSSISRISTSRIFRTSRYSLYKPTRYASSASSYSSYDVGRYSSYGYSGLSKVSLRPPTRPSYRAQSRMTTLTQPPRYPKFRNFGGPDKVGKILPDLWRGKRIWNVKSPRQIIFGRR